MHYLLDKNKEPYKVSIEEYLEKLLEIDKHVAYDVVEDEKGNEVRISTVFLAMDHGWGVRSNNRNYKPVLWETMIFGGEHNDYQKRYSSHKSALIGHNKALQLVKQKTIQDDGNNSTETSS